jgi:hypothetical protein
MAEDKHAVPMLFYLTSPSEPRVHWLCDRRVKRRIRHESRIVLRHLDSDHLMLGVVTTKRPHPRRRFRAYFERLDAEMWVSPRETTYEIIRVTKRMVDL